MNIFENIPKNLKDEVFESILTSSTCKIERIISYGQSSEDNFFYDQDTNEWVIVLQGEAIIEFEKEEYLHLKAGDYINIRAHTKHRVKWTLPDSETIWLAVHY